MHDNTKVIKDLEAAWEEDEGLDWATLNAMEQSPCPVCAGPPTLLGHLGAVLHLRCRNCGIDFTAKETE